MVDLDHNFAAGWLGDVYCRVIPASGLYVIALGS
jgi:hypothetical protein